MMKKTISCAVFLVLISHFVSAQQEPQKTPYLRKTSISIVPQAFIASGLEGAVERMIGSKLSFKAYGGYYTADDHYWYSKAQSMTQYKLEIQPRLYVNTEDRGINGFFFGGSVNYRHLSLEDYKGDN